MSNGHQDTTSTIQRVRRWFASPEGFAAAAAGRGYPSLLLTLGSMSIGTASLALTPGYDRIGMAAPLIVLAGRLLQGFSAGVELCSVSVYLAEIAPASRRDSCRDEVCRTGPMAGATPASST